MLDRFAIRSGFCRESPVEIFFAPGIVGHHQEGRAADVYGVAGRSIEYWAGRWHDARRRGAEHLESKVNLGRQLYVAMRDHGRWARPLGYPPQLFGPWTRELGPHVGVSERVLLAHADHIHAAM